MKKYERNTVIIESIKQFGEHDTVDLFLFLDLIVSFDAVVVVLAAELMMMPPQLAKMCLHYAMDVNKKICSTWTFFG
jgi:hypothetical protein